MKDNLSRSFWLDEALSNEPPQRINKLEKDIDKEVFKLRSKLFARGILSGYKNSKFRLNNCHWPFNSAFLSVEGIVSPCCVRMDPNVHALGKILELDDFNKLWNGEKYIELRKKVGTCVMAEVVNNESRHH